VGFFDLYRIRKPQGPEPGVDGEEPEEELEPLPKLELSEFWPPSPRVRMLYIGLGFFLFNLGLLCVWAWVLYTNTR